MNTGPFQESPSPVSIPVRGRELPSCHPDNGVHDDIARRVRADERARCIKVLESLRVQTRGNAANMGVEAAIAALSEAPTPPVASSPVGGEQQ